MIVQPRRRHRRLIGGACILLGQVVLLDWKRLVTTPVTGTMNVDGTATRVMRYSLRSF